MPGVGDHQPAAVDQDAGRKVHAAFGPASAGGRSLGFAVRLAQHHVGRLFVGFRNRMPDQHTVVARVRYHQLIGTQKDAAGRIHPGHRGFRRRQRQSPGAGAPSHNSGDQPSVKFATGSRSGRVPTLLMLCRTVYRLTPRTLPSAM